MQNAKRTSQAKPRLPKICNRKGPHLPTWHAIALSILVACPVSANGPSIRPLDFYPNAVSADGSVVVGTQPLTEYGYEKAVRWTATGGSIRLIPPPPPGSDSARLGDMASDVSGDGRVIVGNYYDVEPCGGLDPGPSCTNFGPVGYRWRVDAPDNWEYLGWGRALTRIPQDGRVIAGNNYQIFGGTYLNHAIRFTAEGGESFLGSTGHHSSATAVSADGAFIVGYRTDYNTRIDEAFRWSAGQGMVGLGTLPAHVDSLATDVSGDGSVVAGYAGRPGADNPGELRRAWRWTAAAGITDLGALPGHLESWATAISADGSLIVGTSFGVGESAAFLWDQNNGIRSLADVLAGLGVDTTDWQLHEANAISADGFTIVGTGINPTGQSSGWVATIPEPTALGFVAAAGVLLAGRRGPKRSSHAGAWLIVALLLPALSTHAAPFHLVATHPDAAVQATTTGKMLSTLMPFNGKLYAGYGDYDPQNTGPIGIRAFDPTSGQFTEQLLKRPQSPHGAETNALLMFREIGGRLYAPHIDPWPDPPPQGELGGYSLGIAGGPGAGDTWTDHRVVQGIHLFDMATFDGTDLWLVGSSGVNAVAWRKRDQTSDWELSLSVPPQRGGAGARFYAIHAYNGKLYTQGQELDPSWGPHAVSKVFDGNSWSDGPSLGGGYVGNMWHPETFAGEMVYDRVRGGQAGRISKFNGTRTTLAYPDPAVTFYDYTIDGDTLYALLTDGRIMKTKDLAAWTLLDTAPATARSLGVLDHTLYAGATAAQLYRYNVPLNVLPGDADDNGIVNHDDFMRLYNAFGQRGSFSQGDFNVDGLIDFLDYQILERNFGLTRAGTLDPNVGPVPMIPEPTALWMVIATAQTALMRRSRGMSRPKGHDSALRAPLWRGGGRSPSGGSLLRACVGADEDGKPKSA